MRKSLELSSPWQRSTLERVPGLREVAADQAVARLAFEGLRSTNVPQYVWGTTGMGKIDTLRLVINSLLRCVPATHVWLAEADGLAYSNASLEAVCNTVLALTPPGTIYLVVDSGHNLPDFDIPPPAVTSGRVKLLVSTCLRSPRTPGQMHTSWHSPPSGGVAPGSCLLSQLIADGREPDRAWWLSYKRLGGHPPGARFSPHPISSLFRRRPLPYHIVPEDGLVRRYASIPDALLASVASEPGGVLANRPIPTIRDKRRRLYYHTNVVPACEVGVLARLERLGTHGPHEAVASVWFRSVLARNWAGGGANTGYTAAAAALMAAADRTGGHLRHWMTSSLPPGRSPLRIPFVFISSDTDEQFSLLFPSPDADTIRSAYRSEVDPYGRRWPCYIRTPAQMSYAVARFLTSISDISHPEVAYA